MAAVIALAACGPQAPTSALAPRVVVADREPSPDAAAAAVPRVDCSRQILAVKTAAALRAAVEAERCNGHTWDGSRSPLMWAAERGDADTVAYLLGAGAPVDFAIPEGGSADLGKTGLWFAVRGRHAAVVRQLLAAGANPNAFPPDGLPLVVLASITDDIDSARALVEAGGDPTQTTLRGDSVMTYSTGPGARVFAYLAERGTPTTGLTAEQVQALSWEAAHWPTSNAPVADQVSFHVEVLRRAQTGRSRAAAAQALGAIGAEARAAIPALVGVMLAERLGTGDWSQNYAALAIGAIGWTPDATAALPRMLATVPGAPAQLRIAIVELVAGRAPITPAVIATLTRLADRGPDRRLGARALGMALARPDSGISARSRRAAIAALQRAARASEAEVRDEAARALAATRAGDG